jgi:hypothetical protein
MNPTPLYVLRQSRLSNLLPSPFAILLTVALVANPFKLFGKLAHFISHPAAGSAASHKGP